MSSAVVYIQNKSFKAIYNLYNCTVNAPRFLIAFNSFFHYSRFFEEEKLQKRRTSTTHLRVEALDWLGNRDSNPNKQSQSLSCYRYTIPQNSVTILLYQFFKICQGFFKCYTIFLRKGAVYKTQPPNQDLIKIDGNLR